MTTDELTILIQSLQEQIKQGQDVENEVWNQAGIAVNLFIK